ncbi:MAG: 3-phosphoshikimate 1-carboxyvinyltransferase [Flammeovirgaceae bacterium]|nr:3-phosphoshikimate 1-carboxyvinyltransferase [Flammeovirgaceae bacterium]
MKSSLHLTKCLRVTGEIKGLPSSKSISNRAIALDGLAGFKGNIENLSAASDTRLMNELIREHGKTIDVNDAGTTMRFLTAYFSLRNEKKIMTGSDRMKHRPIGQLVNALREIGAEIHYLDKEGFPPLELAGFSSQAKSEISIPGNVSSQFISAILMMAPCLPGGLTINITGEILSKPYIDMTVSLMRKWGVIVNESWGSIQIPNSSYQITNYSIEPDWSAASYWFALAAAADVAEIKIPLLTKESIQGDRAIVELMEDLGVHAEFSSTQAVLTKKPHQPVVEIDFKNYPDLAQTIIPLAAIKGIKGTFTGLESLRIKETDRIAALQTELRKIGAELAPVENHWLLSPSKSIPQSVTIKTYEDHRMAMGFMPLVTKTNVIFENPDVVNKSYPEFWKDVKSVGVLIT